MHIEYFFDIIFNMGYGLVYIRRFKTHYIKKGFSNEHYKDFENRKTIKRLKTAQHVYQNCLQALSNHQSPVDLLFENHQGHPAHLLTLNFWTKFFIMVLMLDGNV